MVAEYNELGGAAGMKTIDFQQPGAAVDENTVIPQIILVLRPVE